MVLSNRDLLDLIMPEKNQLKLHGRNLEGLPYLFSPSSDDGIFSEIYLDLVRCNDLAFVILASGDLLRVNERIYLDTAASKKQNGLNYQGSIFDGTLKRLSPSEDNDHFNSYYVRQQREFLEDLYSIEEFEMIHSKALVLGMIQITFESSLRKLILALDPQERLQDIKGNIVRSLIQKLNEKIGNRHVLNEIKKVKGFTERQFLDAFQPVSNIRNKFVHGKWAELRKDISKVNPDDFFKDISRFLDLYQEVFNRMNLLKAT